MNRSTKLGALLFSAVTLLIGSVLATYVALNWNEKDYTGGDWKSAQGRILSLNPVSETRVRYEGGSPGSRRIEYKVWGTKVEYGYEVEGGSFTNDRYSTEEQFAGVTATYALDSNDWRELHPVGSTIVVYYDPRNPRRSVLVRDGSATAQSVSSTMVVLVAVLSVGWILFGVIAFVTLARRTTASARAQARSMPSLL